MTRFTASLAALAALSACVATPNDPTVSARDVDLALSEANRISNLSPTATNDLPTGGVTYRGQLGADVSGDAQGSILGDMVMQVDFADHDINGNVSNINLIDPNGDPNQRFDGSLQIDGTETAGDINAFAFGDLRGVDNDGYEVDTQMLLTLEGAVYDDRREGDAVFGGATGTARGDFNMDVDGVFFGTTN